MKQSANGISLQYKYFSDNKADNTHPFPILPTAPKSDSLIDIPTMNDVNIDVTVGLVGTTICDLDSEIDGVIDKLNGVNENSQNYQGDIIDLNDNPVEVLINLRRKNLYRLVIGHININFLYGKYEGLKCLIKDKLDFVVVTVTKLDESYPSSQFTNPFRLDRDRFGCGVMIFVNSPLPVREISFETKPHDVEVIFLEVTLRSKKWLLPKKSVSRKLDRIMASYDHLLILGDFNTATHEEVV